MPESNERLLRQSYSEIIYGFSIKSKGKDTVYIKHFSPLDNLEIDFWYAENYKKAVAKGYPTEAERLVQLAKDKLWSNGDEVNLNAIKTYIRSLFDVKRKSFLKKDINSINAQIKENETLFQETFLKRELLIGATVEKFTKKNIDTKLIGKSFFKDIKLTELIYSNEDFEEIEPSELVSLFDIYNITMDNFSDLNIRKIALSTFFQNAFMLCEKIYEFYGKPICYLTNYQIQLAAYGSYYKSILNSENKPPDELLSDPDKLEDWHTSKTNVDQMLDKNLKDEENSNFSIVGATQEDLKNWGYDGQDISLAEATKKAGGTMNKQQLMDLYGIK